MKRIEAKARRGISCAGGERGRGGGRISERGTRTKKKQYIFVTAELRLILAATCCNAWPPWNRGLHCRRIWHQLTDISPPGWSMNTSSDSSPSKTTDTERSSHSSSGERNKNVFVQRPVGIHGIFFKKSFQISRNIFTLHG